MPMPTKSPSNLSAFLDSLLPFMRKKLEELGEEIPEMSMDAAMSDPLLMGAAGAATPSPVVDEAKDALNDLMAAEGSTPAEIESASAEAFAPDDTLADEAPVAEEDAFAAALEETAEPELEAEAEAMDAEALAAEEGIPVEEAEDAEEMAEGAEDEAMATEAAEMAEGAEEMAAEGAGDIPEPEAEDAPLEALADAGAAIPLGDEEAPPADDTDEEAVAVEGGPEDDEEDEDGIPKKKKKDPLKAWSDAMLSGNI